MSKNILTEIDGFTPLPDLLINKYGIMVASVWGKIYRYEQGEDGICRAGLSKIAGELNISTRSLIRHIETLVADEFITDLTPSLRNKPHSYKTTDKITMYNRVGMGLSTMTQSHSEKRPAMTQSHSHYDTESHEDTIKIVKPIAAGAARAKPAERPKANQVPELILFREATGFYPSKGSWYSVLFAVQLVRERLGHEPAKDDLTPFYSAWCDRGYNPRAVTWLSDWAAKGEVPINGHKPGGKQSLSETQAQLTEWLHERQAIHGD